MGVTIDIKEPLLQVSPIKLAFVNFFGGLLYGYISGINAYAIEPMTDKYHSMENDLVEGSVSCSPVIGCLIGAMLANWFYLVFGIRNAMKVISIIALVGALGATFSPYLCLIAIFRELNGVGAGAATLICPLYVSLCSPINLRGRLGSLFQVSLTFGILVAYFIGLVSDYLPMNFRWIFLGSCFPPIFLFTYSFFLEELELSKLPNHDEVGLFDLFVRLGDRQIQKAVLLSITLAAALQLTGISAILSFAPEIFESVFDNQLSSLLATIGVGFWNFLSTFLAVIFTDRIGRRPQLFIGLSIMFLCNLFLGIFFFLSISKSSGIISILLIMCFISSYEFSIGTLFWTLLIESFPTNIVKLCSGLMTFLHFLFSLIVIAFFNLLVDLIGDGGVFILFAMSGILSLVILVLLLPESKVKMESPNEIQNITDVSSK